MLRRIGTLTQMRRALEIGDLLEQGYEPAEAVEKADQMLAEERAKNPPIKAKICI